MALMMGVSGWLVCWPIIYITILFMTQRFYIVFLYQYCAKRLSYHWYSDTCKMILYHERAKTLPFFRFYSIYGSFVLKQSYISIYQQPICNKPESWYGDIDLFIQ
jgi:hypothetical protein